MIDNLVFIADNLCINKIKAYKSLSNVEDNLDIKNLDPYWLYDVWDKIITGLPNYDYFDYMHARINSNMSFMDKSVILNSSVSASDEISKRIKIQNNNVNIPLLNQYIAEKQKSILYRDYNTPSSDKVFITPAYGNYFCTYLDYPTPGGWFSDWILASIYHTNLYNHWKKARLCFYKPNSKYPDHILISYEIYKRRQQIFNPMESYPSNAFILDFWSDSAALYREFYEDLLYLILILILANNISIYIRENNALSMDNELFFKNMQTIIEKHYSKYNVEYQCLFILRLYWVNRYLIKEDLDKFILN